MPGGRRAFVRACIMRTRVGNYTQDGDPGCFFMCMFLKIMHVERADRGVFVAVLFLLS